MKVKCTCTVCRRIYSGHTQVRLFNLHHSWLYICVYKHSLKILKQRTKLQAVEIWEREREKKKIDDRKER